MGLRRLRWLYREGEADHIIATSRLDILLYLRFPMDCIMGQTGVVAATSWVAIMARSLVLFGSVLFDSALQTCACTGKERQNPYSPPPQDWCWLTIIKRWGRTKQHLVMAVWKSSKMGCLKEFTEHDKGN
ncbi:unnamed protein product [Gadus morhua 'NCC']